MIEHIRYFPNLYLFLFAIIFVPAKETYSKVVAFKISSLTLSLSLSLNLLISSLLTIFYSIKNPQHSKNKKPLPQNWKKQKHLYWSLLLEFRFETQKCFLHILIIGEKGYQWSHKLFFFFLFWSSAFSSFTTATPRDSRHQPFSTETLIMITT